MTEYQYDLLYFCSEFVSIIFQVGVLYILIEFLKISKGERKWNIVLIVGFLALNVRYR